MSARNGVRARKNKERSKNFTELEKKTVLELISQHREVLRQGRSNNAANKSKQLVWSQICAEVNNRCQAECPRTPAQVKMWYENYKKKCKMRHIEPGAEDSTGIIDVMLWRNMNAPSDSIVKDERIESVGIMDTTDEHLPINMSSDRLADRDTRDMDPIEPNQVVLSRDHPHIVSVQSPGASSPIVKQESPPLTHADNRSRSVLDMTQHIINPCLINQDSTSNVPLNLSHLEPNIRIDTSTPPEEARDSSPSFSNTINYPNRLNLPSSQIFPNKKHPKPRYFSRAGNSQENGCCDRSTVLDSVSPHNYHNNNNLGNNFCSNTSPTEEEKLYYLTKRQHAIYEHDLRMKTLNMELKNKEEVFSLQKQLFLIELKLKMDFLEKNSNQ